MTNLVHLHYLVGFRGSNGAIAFGPAGTRFLTDFRYVEAAKQQAAWCDVEMAPRDLTTHLAATLPELTGASRIGFESTTLTHARHAQLAAGVGARAELVATTGLVEGLRRKKSAAEVELMRAAGEPVDVAYRRLAEVGLIGKTERELNWLILETFEREGAEGSSFPMSLIVATGPHGALPHHRPDDTVVERGDLVVVDIGARVDGYCSDCTRTLAAGEVSPEAAADHALVLEAHLAAMPGYRDGASGTAVDRLARDIIEAAGCGDLFGHGLGHGLGLEIHEAPYCTRDWDDTLRAGDVMSNEPGVYRPGQWGVRIEDIVHVTDGDPVIISTGFPKTLVDAG